MFLCLTAVLLIESEYLKGLVLITVKVFGSTDYLITYLLTCILSYLYN